MIINSLKSVVIAPGRPVDKGSSSPCGIRPQQSMCAGLDLAWLPAAVEKSGSKGGVYGTLRPG